MDYLGNGPSAVESPAVAPKLHRANAVTQVFETVPYGILPSRLADMVAFPKTYVFDTLGFQMIEVDGKPIRIWTGFSSQYCETAMVYGVRVALTKCFGRFFNYEPPRWVNWLGLFYLVTCQFYSFFGAFTTARHIKDLHRDGKLTGNPITVWWNLGDLIEAEDNRDDEDDEEEEKANAGARKKPTKKLGRSGSSTLNTLLS